MHEADILIQRYLEGTLTEEEAAALHEMIKAQPELGAMMLEQFEMNEMLRATRPVGSAEIKAPPLVPRRRFGPPVLTAVAAMAACLTLIGSWFLLPSKSSTTAEATTASVAVLTRGVNLEWEDARDAPGTGSPLSPGWLRLKSGLAQIEFYQGARVLIEGPAALQLVSSGEAYCSSGKLSAHVPPQAKGFRINTPRGAIVDLGTEFGLDVSAAASAVHVFKGEVELHANASAMQSLKEGQAMRVSDKSEPLAANASAFASLTHLDRRTADSMRTQFEHWLQTSPARNADPALRLRLDFQDPDELRALQNRALHRGDVPDASIVGCSWIEGRWPGKRALEFRTVSDRVRLSLPGEYPELTMTAMVRVSGLDRNLNSIFMCEGWGGRKVHWQITRDGVVRLGVAGAGKGGHVDYDTPKFFRPERFGRWTQLAVVFDPEHKQVRHYADGELLATLPLRDAAPLKLDLAELGNWNDRSKGGVAMRNLSGAMDEFAVYAKAMSTEEIAALAR